MAARRTANLPRGPPAARAPLLAAGGGGALCREGGGGAPGRAVLDGWREDGDVAGGPAGERDPGEREQEEAHHRGRQRGALRQAGPLRGGRGLAAAGAAAG